MIRAAVLAVLLVPAAVIGLDTPLVMADSHLPAGAFVTTWNVTASPYIISIPVEVHTGGTLTIDWGDGTAAVEVTTNGIHSYTYSASGEYQVSMTGDLSRIILGNTGSTASKLVSIDQWGDIEWSSMKDAFAYTSNMKYNASDVPNLSSVSSMDSMFNLASKFDGDLSEWNVSAVTDMRSVFLQASSFNGNVSTWNVAAVTDMNSMFHSASDFNGDISNWNVSAVTDMNGMFSDASDFNGDISSWNVSAVTSMNNMFSDASDFNGDISSWNVAAVTIMNGMFSDASAFNGDISEWDVSAVTGMHGMFLAASAFNQPLNSWNVSSVTNMDFMFLNADDFEQNLGSWYVVPADLMYDAATETSLVITAIAAQNLELDGHSHNYGIGTGTGDDSDLFAMTDSNLVFKDTTPSAQVYKVNVTAPGGDFGTNNHRVLDITVTGEDRPLLVDAGPDQRVLDESTVTLSGTVSDSTNPTYLWTQNPGSPAVTLAGSDTLTPTFTAPDVSSDVDLVFTLRVDDGPDTVTDTVTVTVHDAEADFVTTWSDIDIGINLPIRSSAGSFTVDWGDGKISEYAAIATDLSLVHLYDIPGTYAIRISGNFSGIFLGDDSGVAGKLQSIDQWGDIKWTTMAGAFYGADNMIYNATDVPDLSSVTDMSYMFLSTTGFSSGDLSGWNVSGVTDMRNMFAFSGYTGDLSGWDVSSVTYMQNMFSRASSFDSDLSDWDVSAVTDMNSMFFRASFFDSDLSGWNVSSVTGMHSMFEGASFFNSDLSGWNVSAVLHMDDMFSGATSFEQNLGEWYIVPAEIAYDITDASLNVTVISAQNSILDDHNPTYGIDPKGSLDSGLFNMTGNNLMFKSTPLSAGVYTVNVTAPGGDFGTNNHRVLDITVTGEGRPLLVDAGPDQRVLDESAVTLSGTVSDSDSTDLTYLWTQNPGSPEVTLTGSDTLMPTFTAPDVSSDVDLVFTLRVDDGPDTVTDTVTVTVHDAEADFVTTWNDIHTGINLPIRSSAGSFTVDWGDGKISEYAAIATDRSLVHLYDIPGTYTIRISGNFSGIYLHDQQGTADNLQSIDQWGDIEWTTMAGAFYGADNMIYNATDVPDLSSVTDMSYMFFDTTGFSSGDLSGWNVSGVTDMGSMFAFSGYTGDLSDWDVSSVTNISGMFSYSGYTGDLSDWDVSSVTNISGMFRNSGYTGDLSDWDVSSVENMAIMFSGATSFNSDLSEWDVSAVLHMDDMFSGATSFEQNLGPWYIVLDSDTIFYPTQTLEIMAQNSFLDGQNPMYDLGVEGDFDLFVVDAGTLGLDPNSDPPPNGIYQVSVTSTGIFGTANHHTVSVRVNNADPAVTPPTFDSSVLNNMTGVLTIVFSETIDVTPTNSTKIHIRESGNYTGGITLSAGELDTTSDGATISFTLTPSHLTTVTGLTTPELTIEPGAVQDTFGNLIDGTFDASTAVFVDATSVASRDDKPQGMAFSNDGTKMFVVGDQNNVIIEYTLSKAFDVSTADFADTFSVSSEDGIPTGMAFSNDGTKMFVIGDVGDDINEYTLRTAYDVSTASYNGDAERFSVLSEGRYPTDMAFSNDGAQMFVLDNTDDEINEYTLSTPFDVSTATSTDVIFSVTTEEDFPLGIAFSNDGAKMFVVGSRGNDVNEYALITAFDISTAVFVNATALISSGDIATSGIAFSNDGAKMFAVTYFGDEIYEYTLSSVYPITVTDTVNQAPSADAGNDRQVDEGGSITLQGSGSDPDGNDNDLTYSWSQSPASPVISFDNRTLATPEITAPSVTAETEITLTLRVDDGTDHTTDTMVLTIQDVPPVNQAPSADAGNDRQVDEGGSITLQGSGSDPDGNDNDLTYSWSQSPASPVISFDNRTLATPEITAPSVTAETEITLTLRVDDGTDHTTDTMVLTIQDVPPVNQAPSADAGNDRQVDEGGSITLQGSGSDPDGNDNDLTYSWSQSPATPVISFDNRTSTTPEITAPSVTAETEITLTLRVDDGTDHTTDTMVLTIQDVPPVNQAPSADAGNDRQVDEGGSITLQGSGSDPDGNDNDLTYSWSQSPASPVISFDNRTLATPEITAPSVTAETEITLTLRVDDGTDHTTDTMVLTIQDVPPVNQAPSADAGNDRQVDEGGSITLQGSGSDPDGNDNDLTYSWSQSPASPVISFDNRTLATPEITAPSVTAETEITLTLRVDDGTDHTTDTMVLTIQDVPPVNQAPSADAGNDRQVDEGGSITLQGSGSDPDGNDNDLTYSWSQSPASPVISFDNRTLATPEITAPSVTAETEITLTLRVDDGTDHTTDTMVLTIQDVPLVNQAPSADAGNDRQVDEGGSITLQGSGSDPDGNDNDLTYSWSQSPASPVISFDNRTLATPEITAPSVTAETEITLTLRVDDGTDHTTDTMVLTIQDVPPVNQAPSADAGNDRQVDEGGSITLQGSGSDPDGNDNDLTYSWSQSPATPVISFDNRTLATPEITAPSVTAETEITLTLRVDDGTDHTTDTMVLTIQDVPLVNQAPSADAGNDRQVDEEGSITLQGSGSDPDGSDSDLTYLWSQSPATPVISFDNRTLATPEITAPSVTVETEITLTLRVDDGTDHTTDTMVLTIQDVPLVNQAPSADAGNDRQVDEEGSITLQGSGSDPDGSDSDLTYLWSQSPATPVISFDNRTSTTPEITAPSVTAETEITLTLRVDDGTDHTTDTMVLTIQDVPLVNQAPSADAGNDRQVDEEGSITLQGSGSDPDGSDSDLTYLWSQSPATPVISFDNRTLATPEITAPSVTVETEITLTLRVDDGTDYTTDTMVLTIQDVTTDNIRPAVNVGPNQTVKEGEQVSMPWTASDPDGDTMTYSWSQNPLTPAITLGSPNLSPTTFTAPQVDDDTVFTLTLEVTAGTHTVDDSLSITVKNNHSPTVNAGADRTVNEGVPVTLSGTASDPDGDPLTYEWTRVSGPTPTDLTGDTTKSLRFTAPGVSPDEDIIFRFTATDDSGEFAEDTVTITVSDVPITVLSATYNPGSGTLLITFDQDIDTVDYYRLHVRSAGSDIGGITLSNVVPEPTSSDRTITVVLDSDMRETYADLTGPHLVVEDGAVTDTDGDLTEDVPPQPIRDASQKRSSSSSSKAPLVNMIALAQARIVDIPPHIAEQVASHDDSDPLEPLMLDGTFDFPLVINGYGYLLDDVTNTLVPQTVTVGDDGPTVITFTVYTQKDLAHFTLYLNLSGANTDYTNSDTYITYKDDGTTVVTDSHGYIGDDTAITVTQDDSMPEKKIVRITVEFGEEPMGPTNMVAYMWNTDRKAVFIKIIDAFEVVAALLEPVVQVADPEPLEPDSVLPADPEPVPYDILGPDDYDEAQVLHIIRMWSGFESEFITDEQMLTSLGFDYLNADMPDWVMTELGVLTAKGEVTVDEFMLALQYVLENL